MKDVKTIRQMREWLDTAGGVSPAVRRAAETVVARATDDLTAQHRARYDSAVKVRDDQCNALVRRVGNGAVSELKQLVEEVKTGRVSAKEARKKIRAYMDEYQLWTKERDAIAQGEELLEQRAAQTPEEFQEEMMDRFSAVTRATPDMASLVEKQVADDDWARRHAPKASWEPVDHSDAPSVDDILAAPEG